MPLVAHSIQPVFPARYTSPADRTFHPGRYLAPDHPPPWRVTLLLGASAPSASPSLLFGSLAVINVVFVGLFFLVRWTLSAFRPQAPSGSPTTISRLPGGSSADGGPSTNIPSVAISGVAAAGPDGPFTSPLSRETCAWYRLQSFKRRQGIDDVHWEKVSELISEGDVVITDGTGTVRLSMADVEHFGGWFVRSTSQPRRPVQGSAGRVGTALLGRSGLRQDEYVIPVGARVTLLGNLVTVDGRVRPAPGAPKLVATPMSVEAWQADQAALRVRVRRTRVLTYATCAVMVTLVNVVVLWAALNAMR